MIFIEIPNMRAVDEYGAKCAGKLYPSRGTEMGYNRGLLFADGRGTQYAGLST
jgi:hypothetical protein